MSTQDDPHEDAGTSPLAELAQEGPVVTDPQDRFGTADDPDAIDAGTGQRDSGDPGGDALGVAAVAGAGTSSSAGPAAVSAPLLDGSRDVETNPDGEDDGPGR